MFHGDIFHGLGMRGEVFVLGGMGYSQVCLQVSANALGWGRGRAQQKRWGCRGRGETAASDPFCGFPILACSFFRRITLRRRPSLSYLVSTTLLR